MPPENDQMTCHVPEKYKMTIHASRKLLNVHSMPYKTYMLTVIWYYRKWGATTIGEVRGGPNGGGGCVGGGGGPD